MSHLVTLLAALSANSSGPVWVPFESEKYVLDPMMFFCKSADPKLGTVALFLRHDEAANVVSLVRFDNSGEVARMKSKIMRFSTYETGDHQANLRIEGESEAGKATVTTDGNAVGVEWKSGNVNFLGVCEEVPAPPEKTE